MDPAWPEPTLQLDPPRNFTDLKRRVRTMTLVGAAVERRDGTFRDRTADHKLVGVERKVEVRGDTFTFNDRHGSTLHLPHGRASKWTLDGWRVTHTEPWSDDGPGATRGIAEYEVTCTEPWLQKQRRPSRMSARAVNRSRDDAGQWTGTTDDGGGFFIRGGPGAWLFELADAHGVLQAPGNACDSPAEAQAEVEARRP